MANNCTVILLQQLQDGTIHSEIFHWDDRPEGETVPPAGDIRNLLARKVPADVKFTRNPKKNFSTRAATITGFTNFINTEYSDTPA